MTGGDVAAMLLGTSPGHYWVLYAALIAESSGASLLTLSAATLTWLSGPSRRRHPTPGTGAPDRMAGAFQVSRETPP
jgi:hypothetical protein